MVRFPFARSLMSLQGTTTPDAADATQRIAVFARRPRRNSRL
jgi:hypothetical protein